MRGYGQLRVTSSIPKWVHLGALLFSPRHNCHGFHGLTILYLDLGLAFSLARLNGCRSVPLAVDDFVTQSAGSIRLIGLPGAFGPVAMFEEEPAITGIALPISVYCVCNVNPVHRRFSLTGQGDSLVKTSLFFSTTVGALLLGVLGCGCGKSDGDVGAGAPGTTPPTSPSATAKARPAPTAPPVVATGDTIKIGTVASMTGDNKPWGEDSYEGSKLAVDEFNAAGGLNGKKVELLLEDSGSKQDQAKTAAEKLMSEGVIGIVGEVSSGNTIQIAKSAFEKGIPVIAVGATRTDLTQLGTNVFRVCYTDDFQGPVMATFAYDKLGLRKMAVMTDNNLPYSQGLSASFKDTFTKLGGQIVAEGFYQSGGNEVPDFAGKLTEIKNKNPDGMFCSGYFTEVGPLAQQARAAGITCPLLGGDGWDSRQLLTSGGDAVIGSFFCNHYNNADNRPQVTEFLKKWKAKHNGQEPETTMGALGYDATALMLDALKRAKTVDSKALTDAIEDTVDFKAVSGDITLKGNNGNPPKRAIVVQVEKPNAAGQWQMFAKDYTPDQIKK